MHPRIGAMSVGTRMSLSRCSISSIVIFLPMDSPPNSWSKYPINGQTSVESVIESAISESKFFCPLWDGLCSSVECQFAVIPSVVVLLFPCNPSAILWAIVSIDINSVKGEVITVSISNRPFTEGIGVFLPFFAHRNPSATISAEGFVVLVVAPCLHRIPNIEQPRLFAFPWHRIILPVPASGG